MRDDGLTLGQPDPKEAEATVTLNVGELNDAPVVGPDTFETLQDTPLRIPLADLLANDTPGPANEAGQHLAVTAVSGDATLEGDALVFSPPPGFTGNRSVSFTVTDDGTTLGQSDRARVRPSQPSR